MKIGILLTGLLSTVVVTTAVDAAVSDYNCKSSVCNYRHTQKPMGTRSYSGICSGAAAPNYKSMKCTAGEKPMTCTFTVTGGTADEISGGCDCTNWSMTKKRDAKITINCN